MWMPESRGVWHQAQQEYSRHTPVQRTFGEFAREDAVLS